MPCIGIEPVRLCFSRQWAAELFEVAGRPISPDAMERFAIADGFRNVADMARFWWSEHPPEQGDTLDFTGVVIRWTPLDPADALDIGAAA